MQDTHKPNGDSPKTREAEERGTLYTALADRLLAGEALHDNYQRQHLLRLFEQLMPAVPRSVRADVVTRIVNMNTPPKDLANLLARDDAELATPVLRKVPFTQAEIIDLIFQTGPEHHIELAKRADLTLDVWLALARVAARRLQTTSNVEPGSQKPPDKSKSEPTQAPVCEQATVKHIVSPPVDHEKTGAKADQDNPVIHMGTPAKRELAKQSSITPIVPTASPLSDDHHTLCTNQPTVQQTILRDDRDDCWHFETWRDGTIHALSPNAENAFGCPIEDLIGQPFAVRLYDRLAVPAPNSLGEAMHRRRPLRDIVIETSTDSGPPLRWRIRGFPRFSFPDGRFQGYSGTARNITHAEPKASAPKDANELLDQMAHAADRLSQSTLSPELEDYARTMRHCVEALKSMPMTVRFAAPPKKGDKSQQ